MPPETLERRTDVLEEAVQQLPCRLALLRQHVDEGFSAGGTRIDALAQRMDKFEARAEAHFEKVEAMIEKSEARVMASIARLERRVEKRESRVGWLVALQLATLLGVFGLFARRM